MSMEQIECPHFGRMIYPTECTVCSGALEAQRTTEDEVLEIKYVFKASFSNYMHNNNCDHFVKEGEMIACLSDGTFVCKDCAEELT